METIELEELRLDRSEIETLQALLTIESLEERVRLGTDFEELGFDLSEI